jgi:cytochrome b involved in lipid metabolism
VIETVPGNNIEPTTLVQPSVNTSVNSPNPVPTPTPTPTPPAPIPPVKTYTTSEVAKHDTRNDCWLILSNGIYDVTPFISRHPGGDKILR